MKTAFGILALYLAIPLLIVGTQRLAQQPSAPVESAATTQPEQPLPVRAAQIVTQSATPSAALHARLTSVRLAAR